MVRHAEVMVVTAGQKVAGWILRLFGLTMLMIAGANIGLVGALFLSEPEMFTPGRWVRPTLVFGGSGLMLLAGGAMRGFGKILLGEVKIAGQGELMRWCFASTFRDALVLTGGLYVVVGISVVLHEKWAEAFVAGGIGGLGLWFGVMVNRVMKGMVVKG